MAITYGFFNAQKIGNVYDRTYDADNFAEFFSSLIGNGVSAAIEDCFKVSVSSGMSVSVAPGFAWIKGHYVKSDANETKTLSPAPSSGSRIDAIVLQLDESSRDIKLVVLEGTSGVSPSIPVLTRTAEKYEIMLAYITVSASTSSLTASNITDTRSNTEYCGLLNTFASILIPDGSISSNKLSEPVAINKGGTGASTGSAGLKNLFASGLTVLSVNQYGDNFPSNPVAGTMFFKKV